MKRTKWMERQFPTGLDSGLLPVIVERLLGTPIRVAEMLRSRDENFIQRKPGGKWSMKENAGHLIDLEELHLQRLADFADRALLLSAWDGTNKKTFEANHNSRDTAAILAELNTGRHHFVNSLLVLDEEILSFQSLHPRLRIMMTPVDMAYYVAEHDDHHLAMMREVMEEV